MRNITFNFLGLHQHGEAFTSYLKLRKRFFVDALGWDVPHNDEVEMDQYDNPTAHYSLVLRGTEVVGGARSMPTDATWGRNSYMLRDAIRGMSDIPSDAMPAEIVSREVWECTRLVMCDTLRTHAERAECLALIVGGLVDIARDAGGVELVSLSPLPLVRTLRQVGYPASRYGEPYLSESDGRRYAVLRMPVAQTAPHMIAAE